MPCIRKIKRPASTGRGVAGGKGGGGVGGGIYEKNMAWKSTVEKKRAALQAEKEKLLEDSLKSGSLHKAETGNFHEFYNRSVEWQRDREMKIQQEQEKAGGGMARFKPLVIARNETQKPPIGRKRVASFKHTDV